VVLSHLSGHLPQQIADETSLPPNTSPARFLSIAQYFFSAATWKTLQKKSKNLFDPSKRQTLCSQPVTAIDRGLQILHIVMSFVRWSNDCPGSIGRRSGPFPAQGPFG
jgi:hypothetical protein